MDRAGRLVVPKPLREALGLGDGGEVEVSVYGQGSKSSLADVRLASSRLMDSSLPTPRRLSPMR